jgi:hypothetical protein
MGVYKSSKTMNSGEIFFTNIYLFSWLLAVRESRENTIPRGEGILGPLMPLLYNMPIFGPGQNR